MYDNIDTPHALLMFREFFETSEFVLSSERALTDCIIEALDILMNNNIIQFDDLFIRQKKMGQQWVPHLHHPMLLFISPSAN